MATGCVLTLGAVVLAAMSLTVCAVMGYRTFRLDWTDGLVVAFLLVVAISAWSMAGQGNLRAAINGAWQWVNAGLLYLSIRQLVRSQAETRSLCIVMLGLATGLSVLAAYQVFVTMPQMVARYHADPETVLREAGIDARPDSPERRLFQDRLESAQPTATFALTNSLAGFTAPWLILTVGMVGQLWDQRPRREVCLIVAVACCLALAFCVLLTRSRTAMLASGVGFAGLGWAHLRGTRSVDWRILLLVVAAFGVLITGVAMAGVFDWLMVIEAPKSLLYRLEYWQSTLAMITDHPWLGCGPGNFQQYYPLYKLPEASETIGDPHNFLMEIWATTGTLGVLVFVVFLAGVIWRGVAPPRSEPSPATEGGSDGSAACRAIGFGALAGALAAFPVGMVVGFPPAAELFWLAIPTGTAVVLLMMPCGTACKLPRRLLLTSMLVLLLNLCAAGGIGFAGVATSFWLLAALVVNSNPAACRPVEVNRWGGATLAVLGWILLVACYQTLYAPVLTSQARINEAAAWAGQGSLDRAETLLRQAIQSDRAASQPWLHLAGVYHSRLLSAPSLQLHAQFEEAIRQAEVRNRRSFTLQRQVGNWHLDLYGHFQDRRHLKAALDAYRAWTALYPNSNFAHAQLAWTYHLVGDDAAAADHATLALQLDAATPHKERKLAEQQVYGAQASGPPASNAEQLMRTLRNSLSQ
jgi:hypothetical protein